MGIPYYFYVIARSYDGILLKKWPNHLQCKHFFLDFNGLMHPASQKYLKSLDPEKVPKDLEKGILSSIWAELQHSISIVRPTDTVQIYIDGVAPIAKMFQQRKRRYLSIFRKKMLNQFGLWDSNAISPGTTFMTRLHASLKAHIRYSKESYEYYLSTSDEVGEGEHKLFERLKRLYAEPNEIKMIHGMDADLIMLSLLSHIPNIYLMREDPKTDEPQYLSVDALRKGILKDLRNQYQWRLSEDVTKNSYCQEAKEVIETYIVLCFLLGNDFIPHPINIHLKTGGLEKILNLAKDLWNEGLTLLDLEKHTIHWTFITKILDDFSKTENEDVFEAVNQYHQKKAHYETEEQRVELYPILPEYRDPLATELLYKTDPKKWRLYYYKHLFHTRLNDTKVIVSSCDLYLKGILWTYHYYKGLPKDDRWYYPYTYPPTIRDLANFTHSHIQAFEELQQSWLQQTTPRYFTHPMVQLLSILPKESCECLPPKYKDYMLQLPEIQYHYPSSYRLQTFMKSQLWECTPVLPPMDISMMERVIKV